MNAVLLTGAGLTKTFDGYLASEMWAAILNQPEIQNSPELLKGIRDIDKLDYEEFYEQIQANGTEEQKKSLNGAIRRAFKEMDNNIRTRKPGQSCWRFVSRVAQDQKPSFIFTLNQDMFFERFHDTDKNTVFPGLPEHLGRFKEAGEDSSAFQLQLPKAEALERSKAELQSAQIAYVKLHGSQGWLSHDGSDAMVIGAHKAYRIENEPLLKWYFSLFEEVMNRPETRLLTIGYGFRDEHINRCIVKAIGEGLKLYVVSPQAPQDFQKQFRDYTDDKIPLGNQLWNGLVQYWPAKITDFYYNGVNPPRDLNPRGSALFRSLGLIN